MDCRKAAVLLVAVLLSYGLGCNFLRPQNEEAKREPKPATCVAFGQQFELTAQDPKRTDVERENAREQARKAYQQALGDEPTCVPALLGLARVYDLMHDHDQALRTFAQAGKAFPRNATVRYEEGMSHAKAKEWDAAILSLHAALDLDPENRPYSRTLGFTLARCGRYDESFEVLRKADGEALAHYRLAQMLHHLNQDEQSREHLQLALRCDPECIPARELLAQMNGAAPSGLQLTGATELP